MIGRSGSGRDGSKRGWRVGSGRSGYGRSNVFYIMRRSQRRSTQGVWWAASDI